MWMHVHVKCKFPVDDFQPRNCGKFNSGPSESDHLKIQTVFREYFLPFPELETTMLFKNLGS